MKQPHSRNSQVDAIRMRSWTSTFEGYRVPISQGAIDRWMEQFEKNDRDMAARILDAVDFIGIQRMYASFRQLLQSLDGWNEDISIRRGKWRFIPYSGSSGGSADSMIHLFRVANRLTARKYDGLFIYRSDLFRDTFNTNDTIVMIDDFAGTGNQACEAWEEFFAEITPREPRKILVLIAASSKARERIRSETAIEVFTDIFLSDQDNIFHTDCRHFNSLERTRILKYCTRADYNNPRGYGDCGYVVVFPHRCPNNTIPILHATNRRWQGLFPRHD